jgi:hypothetical protein
LVIEEERNPLMTARKPQQWLPFLSDGAAAELLKSGGVLIVTTLTYFQVSGAAVHIPSLIMLDVRDDLGVSIASFSLARGFGDALKGLISVLLVGPAVEKYGAVTCARVSMVLVLVLSSALALAPSGRAFCTYLVLLLVVTSFCEQPVLVCLNASHFQQMQEVAIVCVSSAFSVSGTVLDLTLSPLLAARGWRAVVWVSVTLAAALLPVMFKVLRPGPLAVGGRHRSVTDDSGARATTVVRPLEETQATSGVAVGEALRGGTFWCLWLAIYLHLTYGALLSAHLPTLLRTMGDLDIVAASQTSALQFGFAIGGKLLSGVLLSSQTVPPRKLLFLAAPVAYCASHLALVDIDIPSLLREGPVAGIAVTHSLARCSVHAALAGITFGMIFGTLQCMPVRIFGRRDLPRLQSYAYSAILASAATFGPAIGVLRDTADGYQLPLLITFVLTFCEVFLMARIMGADAQAASTEASSLLVEQSVAARGGSREYTHSCTSHRHEAGGPSKVKVAAPSTSSTAARRYEALHAHVLPDVE